MWKCAIAFLPLILTGCLSPNVPRVVNWTLIPEASDFVAADENKFGETRLAIVTVRAPYDGKDLVVLRPDGSLAFDPCNQFAAVPSALIKGTALDVLRGSGLFKGVQPAVTTADVDSNLELVVDELALDCRAEGLRAASVRLTLAMVRKRQVVAVGRGAASVETADGNYSVAFGKVFTKAVSAAVSKLVR